MVLFTGLKDSEEPALSTFTIEEDPYLAYAILSRSFLVPFLSPVVEIVLFPIPVSYGLISVRLCLFYKDILLILQACTRVQIYSTLKSQEVFFF